MRPGSPQLKTALLGSLSKHWEADLYYNGRRRMARLPISAPEFTDDGDSLVQGSGSCTVVYQGTFADSLTPQDAESMLAPFGSELAVYCVIQAGAFSERIRMGWYRIVETPEADDVTALFQGRVITLGSTVKLTLQDRFESIQADGFDTPGTPAQLGSTFRELVRIAQMPITREVADGPIPRAIAYQEDRLQGVYDLVGGLNATPYMRSDGTIGQRPNAWPAPVDTLSQGDGRSLVKVGKAMTSAAVYNRVVVRGTGDDQAAILAVASLRTGPLRAPQTATGRTPYGRRTYYPASEQITTADQARAFAAQTLAQVSSIRTATVPVTEKFNPLREVGDVVNVSRIQGDFVGRVKSIKRGTGATQDLTLEVQS